MIVEAVAVAVFDEAHLIAGCGELADLLAHVAHDVRATVGDGARCQVVVDPIQVPRLSSTPLSTRNVSATKIRPAGSKQKATGLARSGSLATADTR